jgi:hypothetical protein
MNAIFKNTDLQKLALDFLVFFVINVTQNLAKQKFDR